MTILAEFNFEEFKKLKSFETQKDYYRFFSRLCDRKNMQIFIYSTHKNNNKYIKFYICKGFKTRPKYVKDFENDRQILYGIQFWDIDFKTKRSNFLRFLDEIEHDIE